MRWRSFDSTTVVRANDRIRYANDANKKADAFASAFLLYVARPERFELPTTKFVAWCSIQLSYGR